MINNNNYGMTSILLHGKKNCFPSIQLNQLNTGVLVRANYKSIINANHENTPSSFSINTPRILLPDPAEADT